MNTALWILLSVIVLGGVAWLLTRKLELEHQREILKKNMSFMESLHLTGLPIICFTSNGQRLNMVLDTGSNVCIIDSNILGGLKYKVIESDTDGIVGVGGAMGSGESVALELNYKEMLFKVECCVNDLTEAASTIKQQYGVTIHGILGTEFFMDYRYVIDFNEMVAYSLKKSE